MKYSINWLKSLNEVPNFIGFWGNDSVFSNFYPSESVAVFLDTEGEEYRFECNEQYFMFRKAMYFRDLESQRKIIQKGLSPNAYKALGRKVKNFDKKEWNRIRYSIMVDGLYLKFTQNANLKQILLDTGDSILIETSPFDKAWGIGLDKKSNAWLDINKWRGQNLLGFALMEVRDIIREYM